MLAPSDWIGAFAGLDGPPPPEALAFPALCRDPLTLPPLLLWVVGTGWVCYPIPCPYNIRLINKWDWPFRLTPPYRFDSLTSLNVFVPGYHPSLAPSTLSSVTHNYSGITAGEIRDHNINSYFCVHAWLERWRATTSTCSKTATVILNQAIE